jgi:hypothetical protein
VATTTLPDLAADLQDALETAGHGELAAEITALIAYPRGRHELLEALNTGGLDLLLAQWIGDLAETLRCPVADAAHVRDLLTGANR